MKLKYYRGNILPPEDDNLPKYWAVVNDNSELYINVVVGYVNKYYGGGHSALKPENYCKFHGRLDDYGCTNGSHMNYMKSELKILSIEEFIKLTQPQVDFEMLKGTLQHLRHDLQYMMVEDKCIDNVELFFHLLSTKPTFAAKAHEELKRLNK